MARLPFSSLRGRLLLLIVLATVPALGLTLYTNLEERQRTVAQVQADALRLARVVSADHERLVEGARHLLVALARLPAVRDGDAAACTALFPDLLKQYPRYSNLGVADPGGAVFCSALPASGPITVADREYFRRASATRDFAVGEYQIGRITGRAAVNFGYPVLDDAGRPQAVVFAALDLAWLNQLAARARLPEGAALTVIDRRGTILVRYPDPAEWIGQSAPEAPMVKTILTQRGEGTADGPGLDGIPRLFAFAPLGGGTQEPAAYVSISIPTALAFADADRTLTRNLRWMALVGALALAAGALGGDLFILRRMHALIRTAKRLSAGDLAARTGLPYGPGELSDLARATDELAESLQQAHERMLVEDELRRQNEGILDISGVAARRVDLHPSALDVPQVIQGVAGRLRPLLNSKRQRLTLDLPDGPLAAWGDAERVAQILANLLSAAHHHTPAGGGIAVAARPEDGFVRVDVQAPGSEPVAEAPAHPFTGSLGGEPPALGADRTGLALAIVRSLVERHGGWTRVTSVPGQGATMSFTLPAAPRGVPTQAPATQAPALNTSAGPAGRARADHAGGADAV